MLFWKISSKSKPEEAPEEQVNFKEKNHKIEITKWFKIPCQGEDRDRVKHHLFKIKEMIMKILKIQLTRQKTSDKSAFYF